MRRFYKDSEHSFIKKFILIFFFLFSTRSILTYFYSKPVDIFFAIFEKGPNGSYINTFQTDLRNIYLSVILEFCLSSSSYVCVLAPAYTSLCRDLEYVPKVRYIIIVDPQWNGFLGYFSSNPIYMFPLFLQLPTKSPRPK